MDHRYNKWELLKIKIKNTYIYYLISKALYFLKTYPKYLMQEIVYDHKLKSLNKVLIVLNNENLGDCIIKLFVSLPIIKEINKNAEIYVSIDNRWKDLIEIFDYNYKNVYLFHQNLDIDFDIAIILTNIHKLDFLNDINTKHKLVLFHPYNADVFPKDNLILTPPHYERNYSKKYKKVYFAYEEITNTLIKSFKKLIKNQCKFDKLPYITLSKDEEEKILNKFNLKRDEYIIISIFADKIGSPKEWVNKYWVELIDRIQTNFNSVKIVLVGNKDLPKEFKNIINNENIVNSCKKTSIKEVFYIIKNSKLIITVETGIQHIGFIFNKPQIIICGPSVPFLMKKNKNYYLIKNFNVCHTCESLVCYNKKFKECMFSITPENIYKIVKHYTWD